MSSGRELNLFERVLLELMWVFARGIAALPHWFRYHVLARFIYFVLYRVSRYRLRVVRENLSNAFAQRSEAERRDIERGFYTVLSEVMVSIISLAGRNPEKGTLFGYDGAGPFSHIFTPQIADYNQVVYTAHYGLWEYLLFAGKSSSNRYAVAVYHTLQNPIFDALFRRLRSHQNTKLLPIKETMRYCIKHRDTIDGKHYSLGLLSDQAPPRRSTLKWYRFLNQDTQFYDGGEKLALKLGLSVIFTYTERLGRGRYRFVVEPLYDGQEQIEEGVITQRYITALERIICENPQMWLWSHRRWKRKRVQQ